MTCSDAVVCARLLCVQWGSTALMFAALKGHHDTVKLLLDRGAQIDLQDEVMSGDG